MYVSAAGNRDGKGRFLKGHAVKQDFRSNKVELLKRWLVESATKEHVVAIVNELHRLATEDKDPKVRIAACCEYLNRFYGKPSEKILMDVTSFTGNDLPLNLSEEEKQTLEKIVSNHVPEPHEIVIEPEQLPDTNQQPLD